MFNPKAVKYAISDAKNKLITPKVMKQQANDYGEEKIAELYETYETILKKNQALDFDSLIMETHFYSKKIRKFFITTKTVFNIFMSMSTRIQTKRNMNW